jgi:hypothetical protein
MAFFARVIYTATKWGFRAFLLNQPQEIQKITVVFMTSTGLNFSMMMERNLYCVLCIPLPIVETKAGVKALKPNADFSDAIKIASAMHHCVVEVFR